MAVTALKASLLQLKHTKPNPFDLPPSRMIFTEVVVPNGSNSCCRLSSVAESSKLQAKLLMNRLFCR